MFENCERSGRGDRIRTRGLRFWRPLLYQLSYTPAEKFLLYSATANGFPFPRCLLKKKSPIQVTESGKWHVVLLEAL